MENNIFTTKLHDVILPGCKLVTYPGSSPSAEQETTAEKKRECCQNQKERVLNEATERLKKFSKKLENLTLFEAPVLAETPKFKAPESNQASNDTRPNTAETDISQACDRKPVF